MKKRLLITILSLSLLLLLMGSVSAQGKAIPCAFNTWNGDVDTDWSNASNWDCGTVPGVSSTAIIPGSASPNFPIVPDPSIIVVENLTVGDGASFDLNGQTLVVTNSLVNNGTLIDRRPIESTDFPDQTCFFCTGGYKGLVLNRDTGGALNDPGVVQVEIKGNQGSCDTESTTIGRCYDIQPTETSNIQIDAIFYFNPDELNGLVCSQLQAWRFNGTTWVPAGSHILNDCETTLTPFFSFYTENITNFSPFVGATGQPTAINLVSFDQANAWTAMILWGGALLALAVISLFVGVKVVRQRA